METLEITPVRVRIAGIVRNAIMSGEFGPGEELSLTDTAARLGVSRTPVREAFQTLAAEGLITLRMNKGAVVRPVDETFILDHFRIRRLLEGEAVLRAAQNGMDAAPLLALQKNLKSARTADEAAYETYNREFHAAIWKAANAPKLYALLDGLWNGPSYSRAVEAGQHREASFREHGRIAKFIAAGKAEDAQQQMYRHVERSMENILRAFPKDS